LRAYALIGNRTKFIRSDLWTSDRTVVYEYSARNELTRYSDPEGTGRYWVCEYDLRGNRTKGRHTFWTDSWYSYEWDAQDRLTKVYSNSNTKTTEYKYDHAGRRAAKRVNNGGGFGAWTWYSYDGLKVVAEGTSSTSKMYYTTAPGDPGGIICRDASAGTNPLYYHYDRLGNVMAVSDSNGSPYAPYTMDAFGNVLQCGTSTGYSATQSDPQPYHLTTKEWDPDSALFYFNARWYERGTGRFVSVSRLPRFQEHAYVYVEGRPTGAVDPTGKRHFPFGAGWLCIDAKCSKNGLEGWAYLPEDGRVTPIPPPKPYPITGCGSRAPYDCYEADALLLTFVDPGVLKIPDNATCYVTCSEDGCPDSVYCDYHTRIFGYKLPKPEWYKWEDWPFGDYRWAE
jgi:RHS repeat-associated protein